MAGRPHQGFWQRLSRWMSERSPPSNMVHMGVMLFQTASIGLASYKYLQEAAGEHRRREAREAFAALDRCASYVNARHPEAAVLDLEAYQMRIEEEERRRVARAALLNPFGTPPKARPWADVWLERRNGGDAEARRMEVARVALKNTWYLARQAWVDYEAHHASMWPFFHEAPLNATFAQRCLHLCEKMDEARLRWRHAEYTAACRPAIYPFLERVYGLDAAVTRDMVQVTGRL